MKFQLTFKTPDAIYYKIQEMKRFEQIDVGVDKDLEGDDEIKIKKFLEQWIEHGENITIEFDMEANTAKVV